VEHEFRAQRAHCDPLDQLDLYFPLYAYAFLGRKEKGKIKMSKTQLARKEEEKKEGKERRK